MYEVSVQESTVPVKNTALIRCHVPSSVSTYVQVSAWLTDDGLTILSHDDHGKYIVCTSISSLIKVYINPK